VSLSHSFSEGKVTCNEESWYCKEIERDELANACSKKQVEELVIDYIGSEVLQCRDNTVKDLIFEGGVTK